jgi:hypothetical protein
MRNRLRSGGGARGFKLAVWVASLSVLALSYLASNPSYEAIAGRWRVAAVSNLPQALSARITEGLTIEIDRRGLMFDPAGSSFSFLITDMNCATRCFGLVDHFNPVGPGHKYRMLGPDPRGSYTIVTTPESFFVIERDPAGRP